VVRVTDYRVRVSRSGRRTRTFRSETDANAVAVSSDGRTVAVGGWDSGHVRLFDISLRRPLGRPVRRDRNIIDAVAFAPDTSLVASGGADGKVSLWKLAGSGRARHLVRGDEPVLDGRGYVTALAFSPDGKLLAAGNREGQVRLWRAGSWKRLRATFHASGGGITRVAFAPDSRTLAAAEDDGVVHLWDVASAQPLGQPLTERGRGPASVAFERDGRVVTAGPDGITFWRPAIWSNDWTAVANRLCAVVSRNLTREEWSEFLGDRKYHRTCERWPAA
jgi:WD40 repeat protein